MLKTGEPMLVSFFISEAAQLMVCVPCVHARKGEAKRASVDAQVLALWVAYGPLSYMTLVSFRELKNIYHHHPESKKRKSSDGNSGSIHPYGGYGNAKPYLP